MDIINEIYYRLVDLLNVCLLLIIFIDCKVLNVKWLFEINWNFECEVVGRKWKEDVFVVVCFFFNELFLDDIELWRIGDGWFVKNLMDVFFKN